MRASPPRRLREFAGRDRRLPAVRLSVLPPTARCRSCCSRPTRRRSPRRRHVQDARLDDRRASRVPRREGAPRRHPRLGLRGRGPDRSAARWRRDTGAIDAANGNAPLVFDGAGANAATAIQTGILALANGLPLDINAVTADDPCDTVDAVAVVRRSPADAAARHRAVRERPDRSSTRTPIRSRTNTSKFVPARRCAGRWCRSRTRRCRRPMCRSCFARRSRSSATASRSSISATCTSSFRRPRSTTRSSDPI